MAGEGAEVWVTEGVITLSATIDIDNTSNPDIYGGFDSALTGTNGSVAGRTLATDITTLDGADTYRCAAIDTWEGTFDGFKLLDGYSGTGHGAGINLSSSGTIVISNCEFSGCETDGDDGDGGGVYVVDGLGVDVTFDTCTFDTCVGGQAGAIWCSTVTDLTITDSTFTNNSAFGFGAVRATVTTLSISGCVFDGNSASYYGALFIAGTSSISNTIIKNNESTASGSSNSGALNVDGGTATITNCYFDSNSALGTPAADGGHIIVDGTSTTVIATNCTFVNGYAADNGGAINLVDSGTFIATNCTIADNSTADANSGGGINCVFGTFTATNCIFWGNTSNSVAHQIGGTGTVTYSVVEGGYTGTGNVTGDPLFVGSGDDPYDLSTGSSAIDAGNASATYYPSTDYLGRARYDDTATSNTGTGTPAYSDIGAYEYQYIAPVLKRSLLFAIN